MSELQEQVQNLIEVLEHMRKRPGMYFTLERSGFENFMNGVALGCAGSGIMLGRSEQDKIYFEILQKHNLAFRPMGIPHQLEEQGYPLEKIIDETLLIYIEILKKRYDIPAVKEKQA